MLQLALKKTLYQLTLGGPNGRRRKVQLQKQDSKKLNMCMGGKTGQRWLMTFTKTA
jgi:hypothetical protein